MVVPSVSNNHDFEGEGQKVFLSQEKKDKLFALLQLEKSDLEAIKKIDENIIRIQNSTRTSQPLFSSLHNYCRSHWGWYYNWHLWKYSNVVHILIAVGVIIWFLVGLMMM